MMLIIINDDDHDADNVMKSTITADDEKPALCVHVWPATHCGSPPCNIRFDTS